MLIVLNARRYSWHFLGALREMWIGYFFNQLLPTSVGGDGVRALRLHRSGMPGPLAVRVVLTERVFGFIACTLLGVLAVPVMLTLAPGAPATTAVGATVALGLFGILVLRLANTPVFRFLPKRLLHEVRQLGHAVHDHEFGAAAMAVSLAMQLCIAGAVGLLGVGIGLHANPLLVALLFQPVTLLTLLPVSVAGWGIREGALVAVLATVGVPSSDALPLSLCFGAIALVASLPGWFFVAAGNVTGPRPDRLPAMTVEGATMSAVSHE